MRQISARKFRLSFQELTEPVSVTLLREGEYTAIGTWLPALAGFTAAHITPPKGHRHSWGRYMEGGETWDTADQTRCLSCGAVRPKP